MTKSKRQDAREPQRAAASAGRQKILFLGLAAVIVAGAIAYTLATRGGEGAPGAADPHAAMNDPMVAAMLERFRENPEDVDALRALGNYYYDARNFDMAQMFYRQTLEVEPGDVDVLVDLGRTYYYSDRAEEAIATYREALEIAPGHPNALFNLGLVQKETGDREGAILSWRRFLEAAGENPHTDPVRDMIAELEAELEGGRTE